MRTIVHEADRMKHLFLAGAIACAVLLAERRRGTEAVPAELALDAA
jgi:hypothetical protein